MSSPVMQRQRLVSERTMDAEQTEGAMSTRVSSCARAVSFGSPAHQPTDVLLAVMTARDGDVRPQVLIGALEACVQDASIKSYLLAYRELSRFFHSLGSVFSFVAKDVDSKIAILDSYHSDPILGAKYETFQSMIKYEESENLFRDPKRPSGARTVLRLHRALQFFSEFMDELSQVPGATGASHLARECYRRTLAQHHSWVIQKSAAIAMYTLPSRDQLLSRSFGPCEQQDSDSACDSDEWHVQSDLMIKLASLSRQVYDIVQDLFATNKLLDLP